MILSRCYYKSSFILGIIVILVCIFFVLELKVFYRALIILNFISGLFHTFFFFFFSWIIILYIWPFTWKHFIYFSPVTSHTLSLSLSLSYTHTHSFSLSLSHPLFLHLNLCLCFQIFGAPVLFICCCCALKKFCLALLLPFKVSRLLLQSVTFRPFSFL